MSQITINNPTQLSFKHDKLRAENVTIIPTPNNSSDLATMINDTTYYDIGIDSECRYKKVITPKSSVAGVNTNCIKGEDNRPVGAKVCHYIVNNKVENERYEVDEGYKTVSFSSDDAMFNNNTINDTEIFLKDEHNGHLGFEIFNKNDSVTLNNNTTKTNFSFNVPTCVHKVDIEHNTNAGSQDAPDKAKIHIELDKGGNTYYIAERRNTIDNKTSVKVLTNIHNKNLRNVATTIPDKNLLKVDLGNGYIYFYSNSGGDIYRAYWDSTVGEKEHVYSFTNDGGNGYTIQSFDRKLVDGEEYTFLMNFSEFKSNHPEIGSGSKQQLDLEKTQNTGVYYDGMGGINVGSNYYKDYISNYPGLYTFYKEFAQNVSVGYFFLEGTNHIFKINISSDDERTDSPHLLTETDIENGLEVFTGGTFTTKDDAVIDDTYTSHLNFGTLCNEFAKGITSSNILSSSSTASSE